MPLRFDWDKLRIFRIVAEVSSFTKAAEILNVHQSALSRSIAILEESLNAHLFHRHSRGLILTEEGQILYQTAQSIVHLLSNAEVLISNKAEKIAGEIIFTTSQCFTSKWLLSVICDFLEGNPSVMLRTVLDDAKLDLGMREADFALRFEEPAEPNLIAKQVGMLQYGFFTTQGYLQRFGTPETLSDLEHHRMILYSSLQTEVIKSLEMGKDSEIQEKIFKLPPLRMNNTDNIVTAVEAQFGIGIVPILKGGYPDSFVQILQDVRVAEIPVYAVFDRDLSSYKRIQALKNHISKAFRPSLS